MNPHTVQSNTTNRNLQAQTAPAEPAVAENPPPLLDVQPVEVPQAIEIRAELAAVEDLADPQSIEAREEGVGEGLSAEKTFLENLFILSSELHSKILEQMHMQSLDDLAPLLEAIAQKIGWLQYSGAERGPGSTIEKLRALAHLAVENVCIDTLDLSNTDLYGQFKNCKQQLKAIVGNASGVFAFKLVKHIILNLDQLGLLPRFFRFSESVTIHAKDTVVVSKYCTRVLGKLGKLTQLILKGCEQLSDISALGKLSKLTHLRLDDCQQLMDVGALGQLNHLAHLWFINCPQLSDIGFLRQLSHLTALVLSDCPQLSDVGDLGQLSKLTHLWLLNSPQLTDISPLANLRGLTDLWLLNSPQLTDISPLANLTRLTHLCLNGCQGITDISPLRDLNHLQELSVTGCSLDEASREILERLRNNKNVKIQFE